MTIMLLIQTLLPPLLAGAIAVAQRRGLDGRVPEWARQIGVGLIFGLVAIFASETGPHVVDGGVINVRDAAPLVAGLVFGAPAGAIAGVVGGVERWFAVAWGAGATTRLACALSTVIAGVAAGLLRTFVFTGRRPGFAYALGIGVTTEVLHMLLILVTNFGHLALAFEYVEECSVLMIALNGLATGLACAGKGFLSDGEIHMRPPSLIDDLGARLLAIIFLAFAGMMLFIARVTHEFSQGWSSGADVARVMLYLMVFMEIVVNTALFIILFQLLRRRVVGNLKEVEGALGKIAEGKLDTRVSVDSHREFVALSRDINETVDVLRGYIDDAEHRMERELALARQIQLSSLPSVFPPYPDRHDFDLYACMDTAREVGGDFYDFFMPDSHTLVFLVADVSGKGVPAALFMMKAKTEIHALVESGLDVDKAMIAANNRLCEDNESGMFVTAWLGRLDLASGELTYANAGHNPPLIARAKGGFDFFREARPNLFLGAMEGIVYRKNTCEVAPGDRLFLYTDGVTEAADRSGEMYGEERLRELLCHIPCGSSRYVCETVRTDVAAFADGAEQSDDITMLTVEIKALCGRGRIVTRADMDSVRVVDDFFAARLPGLGVDARMMGRVRTCVDEAYSNICRYSGAARAVADVVRKDADLIVELGDDGAPFDPALAPEPDFTVPVEKRPVGGLGIHMLRNMTESMEYSRVDGMNILVLTFRLPG